MNTPKTRKNTKGNKKVTCAQDKIVSKKEYDSSLLERSKYSLDLINGWITSADSKISTSCGIVSVVVAVLVFVAENVLSRINKAHPAVEPWKTLFIITMLFASVTFIMSLYFHISALDPSFFSRKDKSNQGKKEKCLIFYEDIKDYKSVEEYICAVRKTSEDEFLDDILREVYCNSNICSRKMHKFKSGLWIAFASITMIFFCAVFYYQMYYC